MHSNHAKNAIDQWEGALICIVIVFVTQTASFCVCRVSRECDDTVNEATQTG